MQHAKIPPTVKSQHDKTSISLKVEAFTSKKHVMTIGQTGTTNIVLKFKGFPVRSGRVTQ